MKYAPQAPVQHFKKAAGPAPMSVLLDMVVEQVLKLKPGEGLEMPPTTRNRCNWSHEVNNKLRQMGYINVRVRQSTHAGVTTLWRVK